LDNNVVVEQIVDADKRDLGHSEYLADARACAPADWCTGGYEDLLGSITNPKHE
jgi:hypothetical protein